MRENEKPLKPWEAIPAPAPLQNPVSALPKEAKKPYSVAPVVASKIETVATTEFPEYSAKQMARVASGIMAGREAMKKRRPYPSVFVDAFAKAGGMQVPGRDNVREDHLRILGSIVLMWMEKIDYQLLGNWRWISDEMIGVLHREVNRAHQEVGMFNAAQHPDAYGWRLGFSEKSVDPEACRRLAECDNYGLGPGVFPLDQPFVLQPRYDRCWLDLVYRDEALLGAKKSEIDSGNNLPIPPTPKSNQSRWMWFVSIFILGVLVGWLGTK